MSHSCTDRDAEIALATRMYCILVDNIMLDGDWTHVHTTIEDRKGTRNAILQSNSFLIGEDSIQTHPIPICVLKREIQ